MANLKNSIIIRPSKTRPLAIRAQEYSGLWGNPKTPEGRLFYEVCGVFLSSLRWKAKDWNRFAVAIGTQIAQVKAEPRKYDRFDDKGLERLQKWARINARKTSYTF